MCIWPVGSPCSVHRGIFHHFLGLHTLDDRTACVASRDTQRLPPDLAENLLGERKPILPVGNHRLRVMFFESLENQLQACSSHARTGDTTFLGMGLSLTTRKTAIRTGPLLGPAAFLRDASENKVVRDTLRTPSQLFSLCTPNRLPPSHSL